MYSTGIQRNKSTRVSHYKLLSEVYLQLTGKKKCRSLRLRHTSKRVLLCEVSQSGNE